MTLFFDETFWQILSKFVSKFISKSWTEIVNDNEWSPTCFAVLFNKSRWYIPLVSALLWPRTQIEPISIRFWFKSSYTCLIILSTSESIYFVAFVNYRRTLLFQQRALNSVGSIVRILRIATNKRNVHKWRHQIIEIFTAHSQIFVGSPVAKSISLIFWRRDVINGWPIKICSAFPNWSTNNRFRFNKSNEVWEENEFKTILFRVWLNWNNVWVRLNFDTVKPA